MQPYYPCLPVITLVVSLKWNSWMVCTCIFQLMVFPLSLPVLAWHCDDNSNDDEEDDEDNDGDGDVDGVPDGASRQLNPVALASVSIHSSLSTNVLEAQREGSQKVFISSHLSWRTPGGYLPDKSWESEPLWNAVLCYVITVSSLKDSLALKTSSFTDCHIIKH